MDSGNVKEPSTGFSCISVCFAACSSETDSGAPSQTSRFDFDDDSIKRTLRRDVASSSEVMLESRGCFSLKGYDQISKLSVII